MLRKQGHFISSTRLIAGLTMISRILGLVRDMVCANFFSTAVWHYFTMGFTIPNFFRRLFGEGALSAALIPVYTEQLHQDKRKAAALAGSVVALLVIILSALTLLGEGVIYLYWKYSSGEPKTFLVLSLAAIMLPYMILICSTAVLGGLLNVHRHFAAPAAAPIILNLCLITAIVFFRDLLGSDPWRQIYIVALAVLGAGFLQLALQFPALRKAGVRLGGGFDFRQAALRKIVKLMGPMLIGLSAVQVNAYLDYLIAFFLSATEVSGDTFTIFGRVFDYPVAEGSVAHLWYAQRLYQLPLGVFGIALATAIFPFLSRHVTHKDYQSFSDTLAQGLRLVIFLALPASVGLILIRTPLVQVLFERGAFKSQDTHQVALTLMFYSLGITAYFLQQLVVRAYYSFQDPVTPVKVAVRVIGLNLILNLSLIWPLGTGGLALSTAICAALQVGILLRTLLKRYDLSVTDKLGSTLLKTTLATAVMALGCQVTLSLLADASVLLKLITALSVSVVIFIGGSLLVRNPELSALLRPSRKNIEENRK